MRTPRNPPSALRASVIAVQAAITVLAATFAMHAAAADPTVEELTKPENTFDAGVIYVDKDSYKFGEYNGLGRKGAYPDFNFDFRGGGAYTPESGSTQRYRFIGRDIGTDAANFTADYSEQGSYKFRMELDRLRRNQYDDYLTLWNNPGTYNLVLPAAYPSPTARTTNSGLANWNNIQAPNLNATTTGGGPGYVIPSLMHPYAVATVRDRFGLGGEVQLTNQWTVGLNARNETKEGTKLTGVAMGGFKGALVPEPIDSDTTIVEAFARYFAKDVTFGVGYNTSLYRNHANWYSIAFPFSTAAGSGTLNNRSIMNGAPDNQMHQVTLDGSYRFSPTLKFTAAGNYTRMAQNEAFAYQAGPGWNVNGGALSSDSREVQKNLLLRLNWKAMQALDVNASYKIEDRDNRSPVGMYAITQYDGTATPSASTTFRNTPLNRKQSTFSLDGRYTFNREQWASAGYEHQVTKRTADASIDPLSHEINNPFASGEAKEDSLRLAYRQGFTDNISGQISYLHGRRRAVDYEEAEVNGPTASSNVGYFAEVPGFRQFFLNDRNRDKVRAAFDMQVNDALSLQAGVDYIRDRYPGGEFGLKNTDSKAFNLEGNYTANDKLTFSSFLTFEDMRSDQDQFQIPVARVATAPTIVPHTPDGKCAPYSNASGTLPADYITDPCRLWSVVQADKIWTFGFGTKYTGLMGGKLTLGFDASYSDAKTNQNFTGGTYYSNGLSGAAGLFVYVPAANMPAITSRVIDLKLSGKYDVTKNSAVRFQWLHRKLRSSDPQFDLFGITSVQAYIGPGITSPNYSVNAFAVSYVYSFR